MQPTDEWHAHETDWRIAIVTQLETRYPGCSDHTIGHAVLTR